MYWEHIPILSDTTLALQHIPLPITSLVGSHDQFIIIDGI